MTIVDCDESRAGSISTNGASSLSAAPEAVAAKSAAASAPNGGAYHEEENIRNGSNLPEAAVIVNLADVLSEDNEQQKPEQPSAVAEVGDEGDRAGVVQEEEKKNDDIVLGERGGDNSSHRVYVKSTSDLSDDVCLSAGGDGYDFDFDFDSSNDVEQGNGSFLEPIPPNAGVSSPLSASTAGSASARRHQKYGQKKKSVKFANVEVRLYCVTIGDHPTCSYGVPLTLDWDYASNGVVTLDEFEAKHPRRRNRRQLLLSSFQRRDLLWRCGYDMQEIKKASKVVEKERFRRFVASYLAPVYRIEEVVTLAADAVTNINQDPKKRYSDIELRVRSEHSKTLSVGSGSSNVEAVLSSGDDISSLASSVGSQPRSSSLRGSPTQSETADGGEEKVDEDEEIETSSREKGKELTKDEKREERRQRRSYERSLSWRSQDGGCHRSVQNLDVSRHSVLDVSRHSALDASQHGVLDVSRHSVSLRDPTSNEDEEEKRGGVVPSGEGVEVASLGSTSTNSSHDDDPYMASEGSKFERYAIPVSRSHHDQAKQVVLCNFDRPHMRAFHFAWISFFVAFFSWFSVTPLLNEIKKTLDLTKQDVWTSSLCGTLGTIFMRILIGPACDKFGSRICMAFALVASAIPVGLTGLVQTPEGLNTIRFFIGIAGSSFVCCQYWTSMMFVREAAGLANALVAGWGNFGGGLAQLVMGSALFPLFQLIFSGHDDDGDNTRSSELAWQTVFFVPALLSLITAYIIVFYSDDSPKGFYRLRVRTQEIMVVSPCLSLCRSIYNRNTVILLIQYAGCFGVEVTMTNATALYFSEVYGQSTVSAAAIASVFGFMNLFARGLGGACSDFCNSRFGLRGRIGWQITSLVIEGVAIIIFGYAKNMVGSIFALIFLSLLVQSAEGSTFGIVPYIDRRFTGAVVGWVGAGGNVGGVIFSIFFRQYTYEQAFLYMGIFASLCGLLSFALNTRKIRAEVDFLDNQKKTV